MVQQMWKTCDLYGGTSIDRVCDVFEVHHPNIPNGRFKIKILERASGDYLAVPNVFLKNSDGTTDYISGLGCSSIEALQDLLRRFMPNLTALKTDGADLFDWSDVHDF